MWVIGVICLLVVACGLCLGVARQRIDRPAEIWDIGGTARTYTTIVGTLAGFSVTSSIFIANLTVARESAAFESVMALFLIAFLVFISAAMQFGTTPNLAQAPDETYRTIQGYSYLLANASYYLALSLSWLGLPLLLDAVGLEYLAGIFIWLVLFAILGGAFRISNSGLNIMAGVEVRASLAMPVLCFALAAFYRLALAELLDDLLPGDHGPALFAVVCFVVAAAGFSLQSSIVSVLGNQPWAALISSHAHALLVAYAAAVFTTSSLLWLAVEAAL